MTRNILEKGPKCSKNHQRQCKGKFASGVIFFYVEDLTKKVWEYAL
jgi:hypothetical protein